MSNRPTDPQCTCMSNSSPQWHSRDCQVRKQWEASGARRLTWAEEKALAEMPDSDRMNWLRDSSLPERSPKGVHRK